MNISAKFEDMEFLTPPEQVNIVLTQEEIDSIKKAIELIKQYSFSAIIISISNWEVINYEGREEYGRISVNEYDCWFRFDDRYSGDVFECVLPNLHKELSCK